MPNPFDTLNNQLDLIAAELDTLIDRVATLEAVIHANQTRLDTLDAFAATHQAGAGRRQLEVDQLRTENARLRWAITHGRQP